MLSLQVSSRVEEFVELFNNSFRFFHSPFSLKSTGQKAACGFYDVVAIGFQLLEIGLRRRVLKHVEVHCGGNKHRRFHAEISGDEHVVGHTMCHFSKCACRARGYEHGIGPQSKVYMGMPCAVTLREKLADYRLMGECRKRYRRNELFARWGNNNLYLSTVFDKGTNDEARFIGCYRACNSKYYLLSFQHEHLLNSRSLMRVSTCLVLFGNSAANIQE